MVSTKILRLLHFYTFCCCIKTTLFTATTLDSTNTIIQVLAVCASAIGRKCAGKRQKRSGGVECCMEATAGAQKRCMETTKKPHQVKLIISNFYFLEPHSRISNFFPGGLSHSRNFSRRPQRSPVFFYSSIPKWFLIC